MTTPEQDNQFNELSGRLVRDMLADRKSARRLSYIKYGILGLMGVAYLGVMASSLLSSSGDPRPEPGYVAMVRVEGEIGPGKPVSAEKLNPLLDKAFEDARAIGVVLRVNSPGGTPVQSALINERIKSLKAAHPEKKVVVVAEDMVTSGAYFIAVAADEIVVNRSTIAGSIGVITRGFGFQGLMDKLGVERRVLTSGQSKNMMDPFGPQSETEKHKQAELLSAIHTHFIEAVKAGRGSKLDTGNPELFSGTVWTGEEAVKMGLADSLGDIDSAARKNFGTTRLFEYAPRKGLLDSIMSGVAVQVKTMLTPEVSGPELLPQ